MRIKERFEKLAVNISLTIVKRMSPVLKDAIDNPENLKFEGYIKGDKIIVEVTRKEGS